MGTYINFSADIDDAENRFKITSNEIIAKAVCKALKVDRIPAIGFINRRQAMVVLQSITDSFKQGIDLVKNGHVDSSDCYRTAVAANFAGKLTFWLSLSFEEEQASGFIAKMKFRLSEFSSDNVLAFG